MVYKLEGFKMSIESFIGWQAYEIGLPNGDRVVCYHFRDKGNYVGLHDINHNIFRLDKDGKVIWQVTREDQGKVNWALLNEMAREEGREGAEYGFAAIWCKNPLTGELPSTDMETGKLVPNFQLKPGLKIMARAWDLGNNLYELDIETGIATNVSPPGPKRAW